MESLVEKYLGDGAPFSGFPSEHSPKFPDERYERIKDLIRNQGRERAIAFRTMAQEKLRRHALVYHKGQMTGIFDVAAPCIDDGELKVDIYSLAGKRWLKNAMSADRSLHVLCWLYDEYPEIKEPDCEAEIQMDIQGNYPTSRGVQMEYFRTLWGREGGLSIEVERELGERRTNNRWAEAEIARIRKGISDGSTTRKDFELLLRLYDLFPDCLPQDTMARADLEDSLDLFRF